MKRKGRTLRSARKAVAKKKLHRLHTDRPTGLTACPGRDGVGMGVLEQLEPRVLLSAVIIDDGEAGFTTTGTWGTLVEVGRYVHDDHTFARDGGGANTATYTFTNLTPGRYTVAATWRGDTNRATNTPYEVYDGSTLLGRLRINQELRPDDITDGGFGYEFLGDTWNVTTTSLVVRMSDDANDYVDADAVRIERIGELPPPAPDVALEVNGGQLISGVDTVAFGQTPVGTPVVKTFTVRNTGQQTLNLGSIGTLPEGFVLASTFGSSTLAPGQSTTFAVSMSAAVPGFPSGVLSFTSNDPDSAENPFTINIQGTVAATPDPLLPGYIQTRLASGLGSPTAMAIAPDGRIFIADQGGKLFVVENDQLLPTPFLTLNVTAAGERGLLGIAFDPDFASNQYLYLYYTVPPDATGHNRISRFTANGNTVVPNSEVVIVDLPPVGYIHNGGAMHFGADGKLYVSVGDGSVPTNSQSLNSPFGKILRFNKDGSIPTDNPFYNQTTGVNRAIWAMGLRNPFTFAIQPGTGKIYANDVGQDNWEEINEIVKGGNYGWPTTEGPTGNPSFVNPVYAYQHVGGACAITGGDFYNPTNVQFPNAYVGGYFFADLCEGRIKFLNPIDNTTTDFATGLKFSVGILIDADGSLLYLQRGFSGHDGELYRIEYPVAPVGPSIVTQPQSATVPLGGDAVFSVSTSGTTPLRYQWKRDGNDILNATSATYTLQNVTPDDDGAVFTVVVTNDYGLVISDGATLSVSSNTAPVPVILTPTLGSLYRAGTTIQFNGDATDNEDGTLPDSAFTWQVDWYTGTVARPELLATTGIRAGSFTVPDVVPYLLTNVFYRITLTVEDSQGSKTTVTRDLQPEVGTINLAANVAGVSLMLDGANHAAPYSVQGVTGVKRPIGAPGSVQVGGTTYNFTGWSDGGAIEHTIVTPTSSQSITFTAMYAAPTQTVFKIDDRDAGFSTIGNWGFTVEPGRYVGDDHSFAINSNGANVASYTFTGLTPGQYRVYATWRGDTNRATNSPFTIIDGTDTLGTVRVNQRLAPSGMTLQGFNYTPIGNAWEVYANTLTVKLSDLGTDGYTDADQVIIERVGDNGQPPPPAPVVVILDDRDAGFATTGNWGFTVEPGRYVGDDHSFAIAGNGANTATWTFTNLEPGQYRVSTTWRGDSNRSTVTPYTVLDGSTVMATKTLNQRQAPNDLTTGGFAYEDITPMVNVSTGTLVVRVSDLGADGYIDADAVRIERVADVIDGPEIVVFLEGATSLTSGQGVVDFGSTMLNQPVSKSFTVRNAGNQTLNLGAATLPAGFTLTSGQGGLALGAGQSSIYTLRFDASTTGIAQGAFTLPSNDADESSFVINVTASAVPQRFVRIIDDRDAGFSTVGNWGFTIEPGRYVGDDHSFARDGGGANVASYTMTGLEAGVYRVSATWRSDPNRATNTPYTVLDGTATLATVLINQELAPNDRTEAGFAFEDLGLFTITSGTLIVRISDNANDYVDADAIRIERVA
ncbi:MAG: choice-of-anchor D domain-containing protein [Phycisphaera sp.]|nr:choice-of-anchor D domain-containing protein [Phycisphaera sp.]